MPFLLFLVINLVTGDRHVDGVRLDELHMSMVSTGPVAVVSQRLQSSEESWSVRNLSNSYHWLRSRTLLWYIDAESDDSAIVIQTDDHEWRCLNQADGISLIGELMRDGIGDFVPRELGAREFAIALVELYQDPRAYLCDPQFITEEEPVLSSFVLGTESGEDELRALCTTPVELTGAGDARWSLGFRALNRQGGIDRWHAEGGNQPFSITRIEIQPERQAGTFYFPDEF